MSGFPQTLVRPGARQASRGPLRLLPLWAAALAVAAVVAIAGSWASSGDAAPAAAPETTSFAPVTTAPVVAPPAAGAGTDFGFVLPAAYQAALLEPAIAVPVAAPAAVQPQPPAAPVVTQRAIEPAAPAAPAAPAPPPSQTRLFIPEIPAGPMTAPEQSLLDATNRERQKAGLPALALDAGLSRIARIRSEQMIEQNYFGHVDPTGLSMYTELLAHFGYGYAWAGENLALNNYSVDQAAERAMTALMNSPTHRANILADDYFRIGIGEISTPDGRHFFTMIFLG